VSEPAAWSGPADLVEAVRRLAGRPRVLVGVDFDGTLAPLVADRDDARPLPAASSALHRLAAAPDTWVAFVSGRTLADLRRLADPPPAAVLVGSHGAEVKLPGGADRLATGTAGGPSGELDAAAAALLARVTRAVAAIVHEHPGTVIETKPTTAVLHTRRSSREVAQRAVDAALTGPGRWPGVYVVPGKEVVELAVTAVSKGVALQRLQVVLGIPPGGALYAGDDVTDEGAFAVLDPGAGDVTVKVGDGETAAGHRLPGPQQVAELLTLLAAARGLERHESGR
jgi:trehalose-phosphatase